MRFFNYAKNFFTISQASNYYEKIKEFPSTFSSLSRQEVVSFAAIIFCPTFGIAGLSYGLTLLGDFVLKKTSSAQSSSPNYINDLYAIPIGVGAFLLLNLCCHRCSLTMEMTAEQENRLATLEEMLRADTDDEAMEEAEHHDEDEVDEINLHDTNRHYRLGS